MMVDNESNIQQEQQSPTAAIITEDEEMQIAETLKEEEEKNKLAEEGNTKSDLMETDEPSTTIPGMVT